MWRGIEISVETSVETVEIQIGKFGYSVFIDEVLNDMVYFYKRVHLKQVRRNLADSKNSDDINLNPNFELNNK